MIFFDDHLLAQRFELAKSVHIAAGMSNQLMNISRRQVAGRRMDRAFLLVLIVLAVLGATSVRMALDAASAPAQTSSPVYVA